MGLLLLLSALAYAEREVSDAKLQQLLAPIALYPDTVLTHVLIASTYPLEIVQADRWRDRHESLSSKAALERAENQPWDPSVKALLAFPALLGRLSDDLVWAQELGEVFLDDEARTLAAVQQLRQQAWDNGSLQDMQHQTVVREKTQIIIQPSRREVVYVPYYDTRTVYGSWRWSAYPPIHWEHPPRYRSGFYWGVSAPVGDWFYFSGFHWSNHRVVTSVNRPYYYSSHRRYGYHQNDTHHWRHRHHRHHRHHHRQHRSQHHSKTHAAPAPNRRTLGERRQQKVQQQLRHRTKRTNNAERPNHHRSRHQVRQDRPTHEARSRVRRPHNGAAKSATTRKAPTRRAEPANTRQRHNTGAARHKTHRDSPRRMQPRSHTPTRHTPRASGQRDSRIRR
jgi:hypothetical protein